MLDKYSLVRRLFNLHFVLYIIAQQIMYFLVVYLHETALYQMFLLVLVIDECNNMIECSRNNTFELFRGVSAHHREGFTTTGLSVGEDGPIIPLNHTINK
jgi:hypothetical protein